MENLETRVIETEQRSKSNSHRLDKLEGKVEDLSGIVATLQVFDQRMGNLEEEEKETRKEVKGLRDDIQTLMQKPAKRWETIVAAAISAIVTGLIAFALFKFGLKP